MLKQTLLLISVILFLSGCLGMSGYNFKTIHEEYNIGWIDEKTNQRICRAREPGEHGGETLIKPYVFDYGHDDRFIIAKQLGENNVPGIETVNYYIINMTMKPYAGQEGIYGPLSKSQFDSMRIAMKIEHITFGKAD